MTAHVQGWVVVGLLAQRIGVARYHKLPMFGGSIYGLGLLPAEGATARGQSNNALGGVERVSSGRPHAVRGRRASTQGGHIDVDINGSTLRHSTFAGRLDPYL